jgi:lipopolysaccharide biosynthesis glycosyltransferase
LQLEHLNDYLTRPIEIKDGRMWCPISEAPMATEFAISRFCVPFLQKKGWALFVDCDIVCLADIAELFALADEKYAVMVVKHQHTPRNAVKMDNQIQTSYARKNWSSVVLWNCDHPANKRLTLEKLNFSPGRDLHAFNWLKDDEIGELNYGWNCLVGIDDPDAVRVGILHYTLGGPWIEGWAGGPMDDVWNAEAKNE